MSRRKSRIISFLLVVVMVFNMMPTAVFAIDVSDMDTKTDCTHQHDEDCGYVAAVEGAECTHTGEHGYDNLIENQEIPCDKDCTSTSKDNEINHAEDCDYSPIIEGNDSVECDHTDDCGYALKVVGSDCNHECNEDCIETETPSLPVSCVKTEGCTLLDGHEGECVSNATKDDCICNPMIGTDGFHTNEECPFYVVFMSTIVAFGTCGGVGNEANVTWALTQNNEDAENKTYTLTIAGTGAMADYVGWNQAPWCNAITGEITDKNKITKLIIEDGITEIGAYAFVGHANIPEIILPNSVVEVHGNAFNNCKAVTKIKWSTNLKTIGENAFEYLTGYTGSLVLPDKLEEIGLGAFANGSYSGNLRIPGSVMNIGTSAFSNDVGLNGTLTLEEGLETIGDSAFNGCKFIGDLTIPNSVTTIGDSVFSSKFDGELKIGNKVETIGKLAFSSTGFKGKLLIPDSVDTIGESAFASNKFSVIQIEGTVNSIGDSAFTNSTSVHSLDLSSVSENTTLGISAFTSLKKPNIIYLNNMEMVPNISGVITSGRSIFAITNEGIFSNENSFEEGKLAIPTKEGYRFGGWYDNAELIGEKVTTPAANKKYYAIWIKVPTGNPGYTPITTSGKTLNDAVLNVGAITPKAGSIKWVDNNGQELDGNTKVEKNMAYKWLFSPTDSKNYTDLTGSITLWESSTGGGESGGSTPSNPPRVTPDPINPAAPTIATINVDAKVSKEKATVTITEKSVDSAIKKAQDTAKKNGSTNGIAVEINANTGRKTVNELQVAISKSVQEKLLASGVKYLMIKSSNMDISVDSNTLKQLQTTLNGDVNVVSKKVDATKLSTEAKKVVGSRPVIEISITNDKNQKLTNLNQGQISVAIPFTLEKDEKIGHVFGVYLDPNGKVEWLTNSVYNVNDGQLEFMTNHLSTFGVAYQTVPQLSDTQNHWAKDAIEFVTSRGLMVANSGNFQPDAPLTRGMMAMALGKLSNVDQTAYKQTRFNDVQNDQNFGYYEWIIEKGIMAPTNPTTFSANQTMSREEVAVALNNYLKVMNDQLSPVYVDVPFADEASVSTAAQASVKQLRMAGVLSSKESNRFEPQALATRAQTAITLQRFIERSILETSAQEWQMNDSGKWQYYEAGKAVTKSQKIDSQFYTFDQYGITMTQPKRLMVTYTVKEGESLKSIAKAQNCSVSDLARINNKTSSTALKAGEIIKIYA